MDYQETLEYIESLTPTKFDPGLGRFAAFMKEHGNPQDNYPSFHVAGTNGKGSTVAILESILRHSGFKTGRYIGPHLLHWNERFAVNGRAISDSDFARIGTEIRIKSENFGATFPQYGKLTWFEYLTAIGFFYFAEAQVDYAVIEVGLGGLWDATNVLSHPIACGIVSIGFDHMHILGTTIEQITGEKAGIIKPGVPVVTGTTDVAFDVISKRATELNSPLIQTSIKGCQPVIQIKTSAVGSETASIGNLESATIERFKSSIEALQERGTYQLENSLIAITMITIASANDERLKSQVTSDTTAKGLKNYFWPGRFQFFAERNILVDGAHNPPGALSLRRALDTRFGSERRIFVLAFFETKDIEPYMRNLLRQGDRVLASQAHTRRATVAPERIVEMARLLGCEAQSYSTLEEALLIAEKERGDQLIVGTGSFETVKAAFHHLGFQDVESTNLPSLPTKSI